MYDENTQIKDLSEMERLVLGSAVNFVYNIVSSQIHHIEHHDPDLLELLSTNETAQEDFILLQNLKQISEQLTILFGETFDKLSNEEKESLLKPGIKMETFFMDIFHAVSCEHNDN